MLSDLNEVSSDPPIVENMNPSFNNADSFANIDDVPLDVLMRSILISRAKTGATIQDLRSDYYEHTGEKFPFEENIVDSLLNIPGVICYKDHNGTFIFNLSRTSPKSQHILNMVRNQKPSYKSMQNRGSGIFFKSPRNGGDNQCFFRDNYDYLNKWSRPQEYTENGSAHLYIYQLLGDDFFLFMAKMELNCQFTLGHRILQSGLCVSGQTIASAAERVRTFRNLSKYIIVNIGSVDILHGRDLMDMKHDFLELMKAFRLRNIFPIVTTLAPLANNYHRPCLKQNLEHFNEFLRHNWQALDLWSIMVNRNGQTLYECYQSEARYVTGSNQPHVMWNKIGRQRILKFIKSQLL
ncbi:unnamed protein product [Hermetia illucens]|uniref:OSK domain-containing protein n=2 Tax=Hermetia illucens TaxID=343691 RepID=A0A7R8V559_HERIL|nr:unnamed protein product [Hermetia illucens]